MNNITLKINESFNSKLIKDIYNDIDILKYHDKSVNVSSSDKLLDFDTVKNTIKEDTIYKQLRGCLCKLFMQYIELLNNDIGAEIYSKIVTSPANIPTIYDALKKYGIDKEIVNNENIVLSIIKNIQNYLKRLDKLIKKLTTGNFNNATKDTAFKYLVNVYDEDIQEIQKSKLKRKLSAEIYDKIKNDNQFLLIKKPGKTILFGKVSNTTNISNSQQDEVIMYSYVNMNEDYLFNKAILELKTEWHYCKENLAYINSNNYEIPYYDWTHIKPVIKNIYYVFQQSNSLSCAICYDVKSFSKKIKKNITEEPGIQIYLINGQHKINNKKQRSSNKDFIEYYNADTDIRNKGITNDFLELKNAFDNKFKYIIEKYKALINEKIININDDLYDNNKILKNIQDNINSIQLLYYMDRANNNNNFTFLIKYNKFIKFVYYTIYPFINEIYSIMQYKTIPIERLYNYNNRLKTYNVYISKYKNLITDSYKINK